MPFSRRRCVRGLRMTMPIAKARTVARMSEATSGNGAAAQMPPRISLRSSGLRRTKKGSGTPADVFSNLRTSSSAARVTQTSVRKSAHTKSMRRARLSAFHRGSCPSGLIGPRAQLQARLPWDVAGRFILKRVSTARHGRSALTRALPAPACPSPGNAPPGPVVVPVSMMPEAAPVRIANPRGSTALAPCSGVPREHDPSR